MADTTLIVTLPKGCLDYSFDTPNGRFLFYATSPDATTRPNTGFLAVDTSLIAVNVETPPPPPPPQETYEVVVLKLNVRRSYNPASGWVRFAHYGERLVITSERHEDASYTWGKLVDGNWVAMEKKAPFAAYVERVVGSGR